MKAFLIDAKNHSVSEVQTTGGLDATRRLIGCRLITAVNLNNHGDSLILDDEGLFVEDQVFFALLPFGDYYAGNGLVLGTNLANGESTSPRMTLDQVRARVVFGVNPDAEV